MDYLTLSLSTTQMAFSSCTHFHRSLICLPYNYAIPKSASFSASTASARSFFALTPAKRCRFRCVSASGDADELSAISSDVVVLRVEGMMCEGCADSVKKLLESRPQVSSASVNLTAETATVWPVSEAKTGSNWHKQLGGSLAEHLTTCGFKSSLGDQKDSN